MEIKKKSDRISFNANLIMKKNVSLDKKELELNRECKAIGQLSNM